MLSSIGFAQNNIVQHNVTPGVKNGVNIFNSLSVLLNATKGFGQFNFQPFIFNNGVNPFKGPIAISVLLNNSDFATLAKDKNIRYVSYVGGMILGNIIINKFNKGSYVVE